MSTYYQYRDVKVLIAHRLFQMEGWKVYGYSADNSDLMTDYYDPATWGGVAEKNGYKLVVDHSFEAKERVYTVAKRTDTQYQLDKETAEKIAKLEMMTVSRGATLSEEETAKRKIELLKQKKVEAEEKIETVEVIEPGHLANPPRCNWHIEKDGIIIEKGTGLLKFYGLPDITFESNQKEWQKFNNLSEEDWKKDYISNYKNSRYGWNESEETIKEYADRHYQETKETYFLLEKFNQLISKWNATCGGMMGNETDFYTYEKITVTKYKTENKVVEDANGSIKEGQCFIVKTGFNYGHNKGYVYRIHETVYEDGKKLYHAYKLNEKKTKECTGMANSSNYWYITSDFVKWFEKGSLAWCHIEEVKTPYEVEKVVKKTIKNPDKATKTAKATTTQVEQKTLETDEISVNNYTYEVSEDTDTRDDSKIWLVKVKENLSREEYKQVNTYIKSLGGYYSRYKHAFLFKEDPTSKLNFIESETEIKAEITTEGQATTPETVENVTEPTEEKQAESVSETTTEAEKETVTYTITEDTHTKTGKTIWIVKPDMQLSKTVFAEEKRKLATMQGFYSSFVKGFIFKYDPTEKLKTG